MHTILQLMSLEFAINRSNAFENYGEQHMSLKMTSQLLFLYCDTNVKSFQ